MDPQEPKLVQRRTRTRSDRPFIKPFLALAIAEPTCFCSRCGMFARCCYPSANQDHDQEEGSTKNAGFLELKG